VARGRRMTTSSGRLRSAGLIVVALAIGVVIAVIDSRPGWDDTGITVALLALSAGAVAAVAGERPWLWAILVGAPTPIIELSTTGNTGSAMALAFAAVGAGIGWAIRRA